MNEFISAENVDLNIVVAPQSFKLDWVLAPQEWGLGFLRTGMWPNDPPPFDWDCGQYAINYEAVSRSSIASQILKVLEKRRCMLTIDESKALGNPNSGFCKSVIELSKRAKMVRELNGTPLTQSPMDYYGQLRALGQLQGMLPTAFRNRYAVLGGFMGRQVTQEIKNGEELARILDGCTFRALKSDWRKDLPPKNYTSIHLEMTVEQRKHYQTMMEEFYVLVDDADVTAEMVVTQLMKLRQISSGVLLDGDREYTIEQPDKMPKVKAALELAGGQGKTIVSHYFKISGRVLIDAFKKAKLNPAYIQGGMKPAEVVEQKDKFNTDSTCRVLVGQERATALGHTLIGQPGDRCNKIAFYENSYSLYHRSQLEDRNHRGDQDEMCTCYDFIASPIDQVAVDALVRKKNMADEMDAIIKSVKAERKTK